MSRPMGGPGWLRFAGAVVLVALAAGSQGCGDAAHEAQIYRVQQGYWEAYRAGQETALGGTAADTTQLLKVRQQFIEAIERIPAEALTPNRARTPMETKLLRVIGHGEIQAARLALDARRPDLAIERCRALVQRAEGDTAVTRQADIVISGAYRRMGRYDDAIAYMKSMLTKYPPHPPDSTGQEDFVLTVPTMITEIRKAQGDEQGVRDELEFGVRYYQGLLQKPNLDGRLQTAILLHLVHNQLELGRKADALASLDQAEQVVASRPGLSKNLAEIRYTRIKLTGLEAADPMQPAVTLERLAFDFPQSAVAPMALFDAAALMERAKQPERARAGYEAVVARYPYSGETAAMATLRQGVIEERIGDWERAKALLESVPANYPRSAAATQAPIVVVEHYAQKKDPPGIRAALSRAVDIYQRLLASDSLAERAPLLRWNMLRCLANLDDTQGVFRAVDGLVAASPQTPFAAQALIEGANFAEKKGLRTQAATYLNQYLVTYPKSPYLAQVRARLAKLAK